MNARVEIGSELVLQKASINAATIREIKAALTMVNPAYTSAIQHGRFPRNIPRTLEFYEESDDTLTIPRGFGPELARMLGRVEWTDNRRVLPEINLTFAGVLRDYQDEAVQRVLKNSQGVLECSTGGGKTIMALSLIAARRQPTLILVHGQELMRQWQERIHQIGPVLHRVDPAKLRDIGAVLRPEIVVRETSFDFDGNASEDYQAMLTCLVEDQARNELIAADVAGEIATGQGTALVVSDRVAHLEALSACLLRRGVEMDLLTGKTPRTQRQALISRLAQGEIQVLGSTIQLVGEGFDAPGLSSLFLATPIKFTGRVLQVVGRVLRPKHGKTPRIYDYQDNRVGALKASARARAKIFGGITR